MSFGKNGVRAAQFQMIWGFEVGDWMVSQIMGLFDYVGDQGMDVVLGQ